MVQGVPFLLRAFYVVEPNGDAATVVSFYRARQRQPHPRSFAPIILPALRPRR